MVKLLDENDQFFVKIIINWWNNEHRDFPWRNTNDPYRILITEVMLRKTTAKQVNSVYHTFFKNFQLFTI